MPKPKTKAKDEKKRAAKAERADLSKQARIETILAQAEKDHGPGAVTRASESHASYLLRRPTGLISLDLALAGGFPASAPCVLTGPDGVGKDYLLWKTAAEVQRIYGDEFRMAVYFTEFKMDKVYMKDICGLQIAFSDTELEEMDVARFNAGLEPLSAALLDHYRHEIGEFYAITGITADKGLDRIHDFVASNTCQIAAVNSIGFLQTEAKEEVDTFAEHPQQRNEASLLTRFLPKLAMTLNAGDPAGGPNETSLILVNQVRANDSPPRHMPGRPVLEREKYKAASGSNALKHGKAIELMLHNGGFIVDPVTKRILGRKKEWEIKKGKLGTREGLKGEFNYFHDGDYIGADTFGDLAQTCIGLGVIAQSGTWLSLDENGHKFKVQGADKISPILQNDPELMQYLRGRCFQEAGIPYRHK